MSPPKLRSVSKSRRIACAVTASLALLASLAVPASSALATPGAPDPSFGDGGLAEERFGPTFQRSAFDSVETTPDGGVSVWQVGPGDNAGFRAYGPDGAPEPAGASPFSEPLRTRDAEGRLIEIEPAGSGSKEVIRRLLANGQPDPSFGDGGQEALPYFTGDGPHPASPELLVALPSGELIVAGTALVRERVDVKSITKVNELAVLRLDEGGGADSTFGSAGVVRTETDLGLKARLHEARGVAKRANGALAVAVGAYEGGAGELIGLTAGGSLNRSFGTDGLVTVKNDIEDIHADAAGKILVAGTAGAPDDFSAVGGNFVVSRFEDDGRVDRSYGDGGEKRVDFGGGDRLGAVLWEPGDSILLGGVSYAADPSCVALRLCTETPVLARLTAAGDLDAGFGEEGRVRLSGLTEPQGTRRNPGIRALVARPDGGDFAAGASGTTAFVAGLEPSGDCLTGFGEDGVVNATYPTASSSPIGGVAVDSDHRILVLGRTKAGRAGANGSVSRLLPDGLPDPDFAGGAEFTRVPGGTKQIVADGQGRALLLADRSVVRLTSEGSIDGSFGDGGVVTPRPHPSSIVGLKAIAGLPSGGFLVAASLGYSPQRLAVFRFDADGRPDRAFGRGGKTEPVLGPSTDYLVATTMLLEPNGRILIGGYVKRHGGADRTTEMMVARLLPDGRPDRSFGTDGAIYPQTGPAARVSALALEHGKLLVAGGERGSHRQAMLLLRYNQAGHLDRAFGQDGLVRRHVPDRHRRDDTPVDLLATPERLILVGGSPAHPVSAYRPDGTPIPAYGPDIHIGPTPGGDHQSPVAALQGIRPVLAWTAEGDSPQTAIGKLQRLQSR